MTRKDLGRQPEPETEPGEPKPGGVDAVDAADGVDGERAEPHPDPRDLDPESNPAVEDVLPEEMKEMEDTDTEATRSDDGRVDTAGEEESPE